MQAVQSHRRKIQGQQDRPREDESLSCSFKICTSAEYLAQPSRGCPSHHPGFGLQYLTRALQDQPEQGLSLIGPWPLRREGVSGQLRQRRCTISSRPSSSQTVDELDRWLLSIQGRYLDPKADP
ncbi:hypothetical protein N657DRAFT_697631, partial [Parathielavia appendiculata]